MLRVITSDRSLVEEEVQEVFIPSISGCLGILPGHRPLVVALGEGKITYRQDKSEKDFPVSGGYAEILPEKVLVFTDLAKDGPNDPAEAK